MNIDTSTLPGPIIAALAVLENEHAPGELRLIAEQRVRPYITTAAVVPESEHPSLAGRIIEYIEGGGFLLSEIQGICESAIAG